MTFIRNGAVAASLDSVRAGAVATPLHLVRTGTVAALLDLVRTGTAAAQVMLILGACLGMGLAPARAQQPNILLIVADDVGYSDLGAYGGEMRTPNLDQLARTGLQFTNFHAAATCGPTRAMLMSGLHPHEVGLGSFGTRLAGAPELHGLPGYRGSMDEDVTLVSELIDAAGYDTYMVGKWHIGDGAINPAARGFDRSFSLMDGGASHYADATGVYLGTATYTENGERVAELPPDFFSTAFYTDTLIEYLEADRDSERPFFAYLGYTAPHWPLHAPDEWLARTRGRYEAGWDEIRAQRIARMQELGLLAAEHTRYDSPSIPAWDELSDLARRVEARRMEVYAAMVENMDYHIGRLLDTLDNLGERDDTVILFLSDNGPEGEELIEGDRLYWIPAAFDNRYENMGRPGSHIMVGRGWAQASATPLRMYKRFPTEGGLRVPAFIHHGAFERQGEFNGELITAMDLAVTMAELAGADPVGEAAVQDMRGQSLLPFLEGAQDNAVDGERTHGWEMWSHRALNSGDWKVTWIWTPAGEGAWQLYDLSTDPAETIDLAERYPERLQTMIEQWDRYAQETNVVPLNRDASGYSSWQLVHE